MSDNSVLTFEEKQKYLLEILIDVDRVCRKHDIKYSLMYGTLIGAARHQGFIPWDDDVDISFDRPNYQKFIEVSSELDPKFRIVGPDTFKKRFFDDTARVVYLGKRIKGDDVATKLFDGLHDYLFLDLFILDRTNDDSKYKRQVFKNKFYYGLAMSKRGKVNFFKYGSLMQSLQALALSTIGHLFTLRYILRKKLKNETKFNNMDCDYLSNFIGFPGCKPRLLKASLCSEFIDLPFEGHRFSCYKEYDALLTSIYGDWRKLPPEEERAPAHVSFKL